jgi:P27 family predicted phage terminase small subunit
MRGRKPKPTALKVIEGNPGRRPLNASEPVPPVLDSIEPPAYLSKRARTYWNLLAPHMIAAGVLTVLDAPLFSLLCEAHARCEAAQREIERKGAVIRGSRGTPISSPYARIANREGALVLRLSVEFGLTPSARSRIDVDVPRPQTEIERRFFGDK